MRKGRTVYHLTDEEAALIDRARLENQWKKQQAKRKAEQESRPECVYVWPSGAKCITRPKRDGYCLNHWNMIQRKSNPH